jgi:hypothetical protein
MVVVHLLRALVGTMVRGLADTTDTSGYMGSEDRFLNVLLLDFDRSR